MKRTEKIDPRIRGWLFTFGGILLYALSLDLFLAGNNIAAGGISGIAVVLRSIVPLSVGTMVFIMNIPILIAALIINGWKYTVGAIVGSSLYALAVELMSGLPLLTDEPIVASLFGGAIYGAGMAMLTIGNGSTGGTDLLSRLLVKKIPSMSMGKMSLFTDGSVVILAMIVYGNVEVGLYAVMTILVCSFVCDRIILGFKRGCMCMIITSHDSREISDTLMQALGRGITRIYGTGMYSGSDRSVLIVAVRQQEVPKVKYLLSDIDEQAFVIMLSANELIGGNFPAGVFSGGRP